MSISSEISRITSLRNRIRTKLINLGLLTPNQGGGGGGNNSKSSGSTNDLEDCTDAIESINETTPYLLSSTGAKNVAGYKYAQVDTTVFEPIGSSGSINPNAQNAYIGSFGGISTSAPSGFVSASLGQISPSGNYQGMRAVNLLYDSSVIKAENIRSGVSIFNITGNYVGSLGIADLRSTGIPSGASWNTSRKSITIDLDEYIPNFSRSNILSMCGYNISMGDHATSNFVGIISSFFIIGSTSPMAKVVIVQENGTLLPSYDLGVDISASYNSNSGVTRIELQPSNSSISNKFMGAYMVSIVYTK